MKKKVIILGKHDPTLGRRLAEQVAKFRLSDVMENILSELELEYEKSLKKSKDYEDISYEDSRWFDGNSSGIKYSIEFIKSKLR